jgi:enamine deaminase RidA (YjgF/YER057c/UK114 family)
VVTRIPATAETPAARIVDLGGYQHFYARGITGEGESFRSQSDTMFAKAAKLLRAHGSEFQNVLRSWYYLADIDRDYAEFNRSRNQFYRDEQVTRLPSATGIRGSLPGGKRCGMDLYALLNPADAEIEVLHTPTLNEATEYGSAFSRGMKLRLPGKTILFVSGTASVNERGETAHAGDPRRQMERMLRNIQQLLAPHGATFAHLVQVISYLKSPIDLPMFREALNEWGLVNLPNSIVQADVCRPDLLVEMEAIAILP